MEEHNDTRAKNIELSRENDRYLLGQYFLVGDNHVEFQLSPPAAEHFDKDTLAACMIQLMGVFMSENPDITPVTLMGAINKAIMSMGD